jgi:hypothetical protein
MAGAFILMIGVDLLLNAIIYNNGMTTKTAVVCYYCGGIAAPSVSRVLPNTLLP